MDRERIREAVAGAEAAKMAEVLVQLLEIHAGTVFGAAKAVEHEVAASGPCG